MYIEDVIEKVTNTGQYIFDVPNVNIDWAPTDYNFLISISDQLYYQNNALTEKQAILLMKIFDRTKDKIRPWIPDIDAVLNKPVWRKPFRVLPTVRAITVVDHTIFVEFPYNTDIVSTFRSRNATMHELHKGSWNADEKKWAFILTEKTIAWLGDYLLPLEFKADDRFLELYCEITQIRNDMEEHLPLLTATADGYMLKNAHQTVPELTTTSLTEALLKARMYGITAWDNTIDEQIDKESIGLVTRALIMHNPNDPALWLNSEAVPASEFAELLTYSDRILVIVPGGSELENIKTWSKVARSAGITAEQMSVMFRLPNEQADFNQHVRENNLNNPIEDHTRVVFVSTKITKPLVKAGMHFDTVINLGYYAYMHFSMSAVVENTVNLVYYSMKGPSEKRAWQPHAL